MKSSFEIIEYKNPQDFALNTEELLLANESFNNLKLGLVHAIKENHIQTTEPLYFGIFEEGKIIGCALRSNTDRPLAISKLPKEAILGIVD